MEKEKPPAGEATADGQFLPNIILCLFFGGGCYLALFQSWCGFSSSKSLAPEERTNNLMI